ncbi:Uncharacterized protein Rs2_21469 [Raphanus sativus]|nr:Uncharacterized protein Rs2_21469 [Raphanus sativus]
MAISPASSSFLRTSISSSPSLGLFSSSPFSFSLSPFSFSSSPASFTFSPSSTSLDFSSAPFPVPFSSLSSASPGLWTVPEATDLSMVFGFASSPENVTVAVSSPTTLLEPSSFAFGRLAST